MKRSTLKRLMVVSSAACILLFALSTQANWWGGSSDNNDDEKPVDTDAAVTTINWEDLIPDDFVQPEDPFATMSTEEIDKLFDGSAESKAKLDKLQAEFDYAPVVEELDGKRVKLPAYITPLEFDGGTKVSEFLLVPYVGACIHVPPPPANQVVHANSKELVDLPSIYDPVWAIGTIRTETVHSDLAESGYRLEVEQVLPYTE